jgi:hypothetical protein
MTVQPFVEPWPLFQFPDIIHSEAPWAGSTYIQNKTNKINAHNIDIHALSEIRTRNLGDRAREDCSSLRPCSDSDRQFGYLDGYKCQ